MENFKKKVRSRVLWLTVIFIGLVASYFILLLNQDKLLQMPEGIMSFHAGALCGIGFLLILDVFKNLRALKYEKKLKDLYIKENDERTIMIMQKTGAIGINICIISLGFAAIIAGFFNEIVFFTLLGATLFTALVKGLFKIYYHTYL